MLSAISPTSQFGNLEDPVHVKREDHTLALAARWPACCTGIARPQGGAQLEKAIG